MSLWFGKTFHTSELFDWNTLFGGTTQITWPDVSYNYGANTAIQRINRCLILPLWVRLKTVHLN